tara:strand:- start:1343 stop:1987 length:645 start_codon:yes stop_codon:yes gene_type:complete
MALSKADINNINVTAVASKAIKFNSGADGLETGDLGGSMVLLATTTLSSAAATIDFTSGIDSTYTEYQFHFIDIHPETAGDFSFQVDTGTNTNYNLEFHSNFFNATHTEDGSTTVSVAYRSNADQFEGTAFQIISGAVGTAGDDCCTGVLTLFNPANSTFIKNFTCTTQIAGSATSINSFSGGTINSSTALTRIRFKMASDDIDAGTIKMYGIV